MRIGYERWHKTLVLIPRRTINNQWVWGSCFCRTVWIEDGFHDEQSTQYGNLFDVLR